MALACHTTVTLIEQALIVFGWRFEGRIWLVIIHLQHAIVLVVRTSLTLLALVRFNFCSATSPFDSRDSGT